MCDDLSKIKRLSDEAHIAWNVNGRLRQGILNDDRFFNKTRSKKFLRSDNFVHRVNEKL